MVPTIQRRRHSRWKMFFVLVVFLGLVNNCELTSTRNLKDAESPSVTLSARSRTRKSQDIGSPSELAWQAWLLLDTQSGGGHSGLDSASLLRRITPKSVFIAPRLPACPDGYQADKMGRCVRNFNIDEKAHISFLLQRLNVKFGAQESQAASSAAGNSNKQSSGPLQLNIPLVSNIESQSTRHDHEDTKDSMEVPVVVSPEGGPQRGPQGVHSAEKKEPQDPIVTSYQVKNDTTLEKGESMFFLGNTTASVSGENHPDGQSKPDTVVPVAEIVEDTNETSFSEVVDYKIPIVLKNFRNVSNGQNISVNDAFENLSQSINSTDDSPKLVLLLSPTKLPFQAQDSEADDIELDDQDSATGPLMISMANITGNITDKEMISVSVPESIIPSIIPPLKKLSQVPVLVVDRAENDTQDEIASDRSSPSPHQESEPYYDDEDEEDEEEDDREEDYLDSTDHPVYEESGEADGDEILKHSEAGMTIPVKSLERFRLGEENQRAVLANASSKNDTERSEEPDKVQIHSNESVRGENGKEDTGSVISSQVSINGDFVRETTLVDVNTERPRNNTKSSMTNRTSNGKKKGENMEMFDPEKEPDSEPEVVFSAQDVHGTVSTRLHGRKRAGQAKTETQLAENPSDEELEAAPSSSESFLYDPLSYDQPRPEDPITEIHTLRKERPETPEVPIGTAKFFTSDIRAAQGYQELPSYMRPSIRLYSDEANSIHNQDYKEHAPYPLDEGFHSSTKSSVHIHQKPAYLYMPAWRTDRQQVSGSQVQSSAASQRPKHSPILLQFWKNMPLMVDPSLSSSGQAPQDEAVPGQRYPNSKYLHAPRTRRMNLYKGTSTRDLSRSFAHRLRTLIGG